MGYSGTLRRHLYRQAQRLAAVILSDPPPAQPAADGTETATGGVTEIEWTGLAWR